MIQYAAKYKKAQGMAQLCELLHLDFVGIGGTELNQVNFLIISQTFNIEPTVPREGRSPTETGGCS